MLGYQKSFSPLMPSHQLFGVRNLSIRNRKGKGLKFSAREVE